MLYGDRRTRSLTDRTYAPPRVQPIAGAILMDHRLQGKDGRLRMRKLLGREHEKSDRDIPGMRGFPVWRFALVEDQVTPAPVGSDAEKLPLVYVSGPANKKWHPNVSADEDIEEKTAHAIVAHVAKLLEVERR